MVKAQKNEIYFGDYVGRLLGWSYFMKMKQEGKSTHAKYNESLTSIASDSFVSIIDLTPAVFT